jgi:hypothetical protein
MDEQQIRQIIRDEITKQSYQTGKPNLQPHSHDGVNSPRINYNDNSSGNSSSGLLTFNKSTTYTINTNIAPKSISIYGAVLKDSTHKGMVVGNAQLGKGYTFADGTGTTSTSLGLPTQKIIQCSTNLYLDLSTVTNTNLNLGNGYLVRVKDLGTPRVNVATAQVTSFGNGFVTIAVSLASGWEIDGAYMVT